MVPPRIRPSKPRKVQLGPKEPQTMIPPVTNPLESFLDVLNRDQRTTLTIGRAADRVPPVRSDFGSERTWRAGIRGQPLNVSPPSDLYGYFRSRSRGKRFADLMCRLGEVFIVGVCLLTIVRVPGAMSAPSTRHPKSAAHESAEDALSYQHPCGKRHEEEMNSTYYSEMAPKVNISEILKPIIVRTKTALSYTEGFRERYVEKTFNIPYETHHAQWSSQRYDWLPNESNGIPKRLGNNVSHLHLKEQILEEFLVKIYEYFQIFAVGLKQVVADQERLKGEFTENFRKTESHLRNVLCEIREAMMELNIAPGGQVSTDIMKEEFRNMEQASYRNVRDWFIFRDLMNGFEYAIEVFTFFEQNPPTTSS